MNKCFSYPLLVLLLAACSGGGKAPTPKPYKFDRDKLDEMVKTNKALYNVTKRPNGTLQEETYYLGDSVKYKLEYNFKSNLQTVSKFDEHGYQVWFETYYPNGQRKSHYPMRFFDDLGIRSAEHGFYETYYEDGRVMEIGEFKRGILLWMLKYDVEGQAGDTTHYEYADGRENILKDPKEVTPDTPKIEKIPTATPAN